MEAVALRKRLEVRVLYEHQILRHPLGAGAITGGSIQPAGKRQQSQRRKRQRRRDRRGETRTDFARMGNTSAPNSQVIARRAPPPPESSAG